MSEQNQGTERKSIAFSTTNASPPGTNASLLVMFGTGRFMNFLEKNLNVGNMIVSEGQIFLHIDSVKLVFNFISK